MKVAGRITMSHMILVALMAGVLAGQILVMHRMQAANARNAGQNFRIALGALSLMRGCDTLELNTRRYFTNPSAELQNELNDARESFATGLSVLQSDPASDKTRIEVERLARFLKDFEEVLTKTQPPPQKAEPKTRQPGPPSFPSDLEEQFERLRAQSSSLYQATLQTLNLEAEAARKAGADALMALWIFAVIAMAVGAGISILVVRSVAGPLRHLAEGTRALSEGKEFYRLDTSRGDELSQIAKDFNTLVRRLPPGRPE